MTEYTSGGPAFCFDVSNKGDTDMIAIFALAMMIVTAGFAVPALLPNREAH